MDQEVFSGQDFGDLKKEVELLLLQLTRKELDLGKLDNFLLKVRERLQYCGYCNGPTYSNGVCTEHFIDDIL